MKAHYDAAMKVYCVANLPVSIHFRFVNGISSKSSHLQ